MQCKLCGFQNSPAALYCQTCGQALEAGGDPIFNPAPPPVNAYNPYSFYPNYGQPHFVQGNPSHNWAAVTGLVCGILSLPCILTGIGGMVLGGFGLFFGILGLKSTNRGLAIGGLVCGCAGIVIGLIYFIFLLATILEA